MIDPYSPNSIVTGQIDDSAAGFAEELLAIGVRGYERAVAWEGEPQRLG